MNFVVFIVEVSFVCVRWKLYFLISLDVLHPLKTLGGIHKTSNPKINLCG